MFGTLGNSIKLLLISWRILQTDRQLLLFPLMSGAALFFVFAYTAAAFWAGGTFERIGPDYRFYLPDLVFLALAYFLASFVIVYFNAALVAVAYQRLEGWGADWRTGLNAANDRLGDILAWSAIAASVALILDQLSDANSIIGRALGFVLRLMWGYATFFVVPVLIVEGAGPLDALSRSTELFRRQWGRAVVANFGFGLGYVVVATIALAPAAALYFGFGSLVLAVLAGAALLVLGIATVKALETVFLVALYDFAATGRMGGDFNDAIVRDAYVEKKQRGAWKDHAYSGRTGW
jgi:hypothetical protein